VTTTLPTQTTPITLTEAAASKAAALIAEEEGEGLFLRVAVRPGGCSGMSYEGNADV
jgi:Fe-S cluster assembly iron-binding protein IscA